MERVADVQVDADDPCLVSSAALREVHRFARHSIYVGSGTRGWMWAGVECSTLVLGPPRSGKTSSLVIPNILLCDGPVVSTSTKPDVMLATARSRAAGDGWAFLYDPSGEVECPPGVERVGWSPLTGAARWDAAVVTADAMVGASRLQGHRAAEHHWTERAGALVSTLLHAAATGELPMRDVLRWIDRHHGDQALEILSSAGPDSPAADLLAGILATDTREQSGIWSTASGVLSAYRTQSALDSTRLAPIDFDSFCSGPHTLYVCSTGRRQAQFAPLVVGVLGDVRDATYARAKEGRGGSPTLLALDEVANIAPVPDLPAMVSEGGGQGLLVLACLQDLSQARQRWGVAADGFLSLFGTTVVLRGIADTKTLNDLSALAGAHEVATTTVNRSVGRWGRIQPSTSVGPSLRPRLPVDAVARGLPGRALVLGPHKEVQEVGLTPAHEHSPWRELLTPGRSRGAIGPGRESGHQHGLDHGR
jgi:type IV secretion system protein VirD4